MLQRTFRLEWLLPVALAAAYVLVKFEAIPTPLGGLVRPLTIAVLGAVAMQAIASLVLRSATLGSLLAGAAVLAMMRMWPLSLILLAVLGATVVVERRLGSGAPASPAARVIGQVPRGLGVVACILVIVSAMPIVSRTFGAERADTSPPTTIPSDSPRPDIFVIVLDGYPSTSVLADTFGYDNGAFDRALDDLGFDVAHGARSNYTSTWASLGSFLNMRYLDEIPGLDAVPREPAPQHRALMTAIARSAGVGVLRDAGYRIVTVPSPFESTSLSSADVVHSPASPTAFEHALIQDTVLAGALKAVAPRLLTELHRAGIEEAFDLTREIARAPGAGPVFSLTHVMSPHAPYVFAADGGLVEPLDCYPDSCTFWGGEWADLPGQVRHLNEQVLEATRDLVEVRPEAVIILMSDHGSQPGNRPVAGRFQNLVAARTPGIDGLVPRDLSLVNLLPVVLNGYLGTELPLYPHRSWISEADEPLTTTPFDP